jgi:hypothetical protein
LISLQKDLFAFFLSNWILFHRRNGGRSVDIDSTHLFEEEMESKKHKPLCLFALENISSFRFCLPSKTDWVYKTPKTGDTLAERL